MKEAFWFCLHTRHKLDSDPKVAALMDLLGAADSPARPAFFGAVEPVKKKLDAKTMADARAMLAGMPKRNAGSVMLRSKDDSWLSWIKWNATRTMTWQFYLDDSLLQTAAGLQQLQDFFAKLCAQFPAIAGGGAPYEDWKAKHWRDVLSPGGVPGVQKVGFDYRGPLTGVYWLTILGADAVAHFGKAMLQALPIHACVDLGAGGVMLVMRPDPLAPALAERLAQDRAIAAALGSEYFFDITDADRELKVIPGLG